MKKTLIIFLLLNLSVLLKAQTWYFGYGAGIKFTSNNPAFFNTPQGHTATNEGCAVANDANGNMLFYTDGISVWDRNNNYMLDDRSSPLPVTGVNGLDGNLSATQTAIIVPKPKSTSCVGCACDTFYIFTVSCGQGFMHADIPTSSTGGGYNPAYFIYGLRFTTVIFDAVHPDGYIPQVTKNIHLAEFASEKLTSIYDAAHNRYWVLAHGYDPHDTGLSIPPSDIAKTFFCYEVSSNGVNVNPVTGNVLLNSTAQETPVPYIQNISPVAQNNVVNAPGQMKFSPDGKMIALGIYTDRIVEVYDFDINTGLVTNPKKFQFPATDGGIYGIEFSKDSKQLFVGQNSGNNFIYQLRVGLINSTFPSTYTIPNATLTFQNFLNLGIYLKKLIPLPVSNAAPPEYGAFQLGPDGNIYIGRMLPVLQNSNIYHLSCIYNATNFPATLTPNALQLTGTTPGLTNVTQGAWSLPSVIVNALGSTCHMEQPQACSACSKSLSSVNAFLTNSISNTNYSLQGIHLNFTSMVPLQQISVSVADIAYNWNPAGCTNAGTTAISSGCLFPAAQNQTIGNSLMWNNMFNVTLPSAASPNECPGILEWSGGSTLPPGTYSVPLNLTLPVAAQTNCDLMMNKLILRVTYKDVNCNTCDTLINVDNSCCAGGYWDYTAILPSNGIRPNPLVSNVECNNEQHPYTLTCRQSYDLLAAYICRSGCRNTVTYSITGPAGNTNSAGGTLPATFTPSVSGNYVITYTAVCDGNICETCKILVNVTCRSRN